MEKTGVLEKAKKYAEGVGNETGLDVIVKAFVDGYCEGIKETITSDENDIEYVDLGLPSGTLWSSDFIKHDGEITYFTYDSAITMRIPTEQQWEELQIKCRWEYYCKEGVFKIAKCFGPNGNVLNFLINDVFDVDNKLVEGSNKVSSFWLMEYSDYSSRRNTAEIGKRIDGRQRTCSPFYSPEFKLPVRLVR